MWKCSTYNRQLLLFLFSWWCCCKKRGPRYYKAASAGTALTFTMDTETELAVPNQDPTATGWRARLKSKSLAHVTSKLNCWKSEFNFTAVASSPSFCHGGGVENLDAISNSEGPSQSQSHNPSSGLHGSLDIADVDSHSVATTTAETSLIFENSRWIFGKVLDPRSKAVQEWNRMFLLISGVGLVIDPLFFYALSVSDKFMCLYLDGWFAITVTVLRTMTDAMHLWNMWLQLKLACVSKESLVVGSGVLITDPRSVALRYLTSGKGFWFDVFVILPLPQIVLWVVAPALIKKGKISMVMDVFLIMFLFQYLPKVYHSICLLRRMQRVTGYVFGTIWWGFALNMLAYFVAAHAAGACWYLLGIQRAAKCLQMKCEITPECQVGVVGCSNPIYYGPSILKDSARIAWSINKNAQSVCIDGDPDSKFSYGAYKWVAPLVTNENRLEKVLFPIFWGLMTLSTFGNLESTTEWLEVIFNIIMLTSGLLLVTMLIGNIKVFLHAAASRKQTMQLRMRNMERWMKRRQLPHHLRQRVRQYERQKWAAMRGVDESAMIHNFPEGLRRDVKYHLCLDLVRQVPLFQHMEDLVLENICDKVRSVIYTKGETITKEGDPVQRMLFIVRGHMKSTQQLTNGLVSTCMLGPGNFCGDELLAWCLRRPSVDRLPLSSATFVSAETTEAFALEAHDLKYVTQHFRYTFLNDRIKRTARYYSPGWRTWAAVAIQLAWRRYRQIHSTDDSNSSENNNADAGSTISSSSIILDNPDRRLRRSSSHDSRVRLYAALFASPKPHEDDFPL